MAGTEPVDDPTGPPAANDHQSDADASVGSQDWLDLSHNRPGQGIRAKATAIERSTPIKVLIGRALGFRTAERAWRVGADGEVEVGWQLRRLGPNWHVLHSVPVGQNDSDIDHVVIGPAGVFTLNTKHHPGKNVWVAGHSLLVNGTKTSYLRNSRFEADRASRLLSAACGLQVQAQPVIVVMAASLTIKAPPVDVFVVGRKSIVKWLSRRPRVLGPEIVEQIFEHARRDSTWRSGLGGTGTRR